MGMQLRSIAITGALCAVAGGMVLGRAGWASSPGTSAQPMPPAELRVSPVVVLAKRPSVNEILDLILGDRGGSQTVCPSARYKGAERHNKEYPHANESRADVGRCDGVGFAGSS